MFACIMVFSILSFNKVVTDGYDFSQPTLQLSLPDTLREISGITLVDESTVACVQDENGILFFYDIHENDIIRQQQFNLDGDYEGIAKVGSNIYVLRSDGVLFAIKNYNSKQPKIDSIATNIPVDNNEGLCYDRDHNRLLIACKNKSRNAVGKRNTRSIYAFDLSSNTCSADPLYEIDLQDLKAFAKEKHVDFPKRAKAPGKEHGSDEPILRFRPSEIAIHPISKRLFMLSAVDHALFIFSPAGQLVHIELLNPEVFNKAEGITFLENGDLLISNEGQAKKPSIVRFNYVTK